MISADAPVAKLFHSLMKMWGFEPTIHCDFWGRVTKVVYRQGLVTLSVPVLK